MEQRSRIQKWSSEKSDVFAKHTFVPIIAVCRRAEITSLTRMSFQEIIHRVLLEKIIKTVHLVALEVAESDQNPLYITESLMLNRYKKKQWLLDYKQIYTRMYVHTYALARCANRLEISMLEKKILALDLRCTRIENILSMF